MTDRYTALVQGGAGRRVASTLGLPRPAVLRRHEAGEPLLPGPARLVGDGPVGALLTSLPGAPVELDGDAPAGDRAGADDRLGAVVVDATGHRTPRDLVGVRAALATDLRRLGRSGRLVVVGRPPEDASDVTQAATRQALEGLTRSLAKELREGATANLVLVADGADDAARSTLAFLLSARSAFVDGQVVRVRAPVGAVREVDDPARPLQGAVAAVTGAARGIGAAIAHVLARQGARVLAVDVPAAGQALAGTANAVGGTALQVDVTAADAGRRIADLALSRYGSLDVVVHNAGITRDRLLVNSDPDAWASVLAVNLEAQLRIDDTLLGERVLADGGRVVSLASTSGIAGQRGQTNYAASKAGVIGMVRARAGQVADRGITVNAVAPGFIETEMTARMPFATREVARRLNSLAQGGQPVDVAETVAWFAEPGSAGVTGQVVRVCGQLQVGA
ncbi:3-oxoacyl-ACP reductase [Angustibacter aerolatus]